MSSLSLSPCSFFSCKKIFMWVNCACARACVPKPTHSTRAPTHSLSPRSASSPALARRELTLFHSSHRERLLPLSSPSFLPPSFLPFSAGIAHSGSVRACACAYVRACESVSAAVGVVVDEINRAASPLTSTTPRRGAEDARITTGEQRSFFFLLIGEDWGFFCLFKDKI